MLEVVAEKTGYPSDMLSAEMDLEGDLGIDSIKRVEILSTMRERAPSLPEVEPSQMATLRTLGEIASHLDASLAVTPAVSVAVQNTSVAITPVSVPTIDLQALLLEVVAEKTGYPSDMLSAEMDLEGDLGIDSIKRVEILSTMRERAPSLPEVEPSQMAALRTLGEIASHLDASLAVTPAVSALVSAPVPVPTTEIAVPVRRFSVELVAAPALGLAQPGLLRATSIAVMGDSGIAEALADRLSEFGVRAHFATEVAPTDDGVIFLGGLAPISRRAEAWAINRAAFRTARDIADRAKFFATVQDLCGSFGLANTDGVRAHLGGLAGLAKTARIEWPDASVKAIDIEASKRSDIDVADALADELLRGGSEVEVALAADGRRATLRTVETEPAPGPLPIDADSVVVVSGGARGVTAATVIAMASAAHAGRFILLGRTPLADEPANVRVAVDDTALKRVLLDEARSAGQRPTPAELGRRVSKILAAREVRATLRAIEAQGATARYVALDVTDAGQVAQRLTEVRAEFGPITGLIHGAGVLADKRIADKTDDQFDRVFDTKVKGVDALLSATASDPLRFVTLYSSVAGRVGNTGQCDYAMANEVLSKVAHTEAFKRKGTCVVRAIGWGPWAGGMVTPELATHFANAGVSLIPLEAGAAHLVAEISSTSGGGEVVVGCDEPRASLPTSTSKRGEFGVVVRASTHPYLASHAIDGAAVVPVALVLEWFARAARAHRSDLLLGGIRDLKVLRGIRLGQFEGQGDRFFISSREVSNGDGAVLDLGLADAAGRPQYKASASMVVSRALAAPSPTVDVSAWAGEIYDGDVLFHGPDFQVIRSLDGVSNAGISGQLNGVRSHAWPTESWVTDSAAVDGGLQLALLWAKHVLGGASLPTGISEVRTFTDAAPTGMLRCVLTGRTANRDKAVSDVVLIDDRGTVVAELLGVETHQLPSR